MRAMSATGALLGSPILRSQGMTGDIFNRDLVLKASRFGPGVTGGSWRKPRLGARRRLPSYISAKSFGEAVIDLLVPDAAGRMEGWISPTGTRSLRPWANRSLSFMKSGLTP